MRSLKARTWLLPLFIFHSSISLAQTRSTEYDTSADPRGRSDLVVCSQNLANYGSFAATKARVSHMLPEDFEEKEESLIKRFSKRKCDIIAVQEVLGDEGDAKEALDKLGSLLRAKTGRIFGSVVGQSFDPSSRVGFLYALDRVEKLLTVSYAKVELPKLVPDQRPRFFPRGPLELQVRVKASPGGKSRLVTLITFHFKSKRGGAGDPAELQWETARMEMSEALRRIVAQRHRDALESAERVLILLGDRNSNYDLASAKILEGTLALASFQENGPCRLSKRGVPLCKAGAALAPKLLSVLTSDPQTQLQPGTFQYKKVFSWLDDILLPSPSAQYALRYFDKAGDYDSGVVMTPEAASDHGMVYVVLNW